MCSFACFAARASNNSMMLLSGRAILVIWKFTAKHGFVFQRNGLKQVLQSVEA
jgi:hypothetical protein